MDFVSDGVPVIITILIIALSGLTSSAILAGFFFVMAKTKAERRRLVTTGIPSRAVIVQMRNTGVHIGDQPRVSIVLDVQPVAGYRATAAPFRTTLTTIVPLIALARVTPGEAGTVATDGPSLLPDAGHRRVGSDPRFEPLALRPPSISMQRRAAKLSRVKEDRT